MKKIPMAMLVVVLNAITVMERRKAKAVVPEEFDVFWE